ncbi:F-box protein [Fluoribacter gormanii]|uniref:F-box protein n=1 Tax=Fluoribacter gormanii TaxID=464 RepID=UPI0010419074|nr:F-box protein [Fluoribacter gormanii]MCW8470782.1 F-box protein [Fluoribacter gormanii]
MKCCTLFPFLTEWLNKMHGVYQDTQNNKELDTTDTIDASASEATEGKSQKSSIQSLRDMALAVIAKDPFLSIKLIQNNSFEDSLIPEILTKITPFIHLVPAEVKCELLTFLPIRDWNSLSKVSKEWRQLVIVAAELFLNEVARDKPTVISVDNFNGMLNSLLENVERYSKEARRRPAQVRELKQLESEVNSLTQPLAKLFYCQKRLDEIQRAIAREYGISTLVSIFSGPGNSQLYQIIESFLVESQEFNNSSWYKKVQYCVSMCPEHVIAQQFSAALLEIKNLQDDIKIPLVSATFRS